MNSESAREEADPGFAQGWSQFGFGDTLVQICNLQICTKRVLHEDGPYPKAVKRWYNSERLLHWNDIGCSEHSSCVHFSWSQGIGGTQILFRNLPKVSNFGGTLRSS